jgi:hypothetical protein
MRRWIVICIAALCLAGTAIAQNTVSVAAPTAPAPAAANTPYSEGTKWLFGIGYVYQRFNLGGSSTNLNGIQSSFSRFANNYFAFEGAVTATFGTFSATQNEHLVFYGGGGRLQSRGHKMEPWVHALFGGTHTRFTQGVGPGSFNGLGIMAGGGVDYRIGNHSALRVQGDFFTSHINAAWQKTVTVGAGIVFDF